MIYLYNATERELIVEDRFQKLNIIVDWTYLRDGSKQIKKLYDEIRKKEQGNIQWKKFIYWRSKV